MEAAQKAIEKVDAYIIVYADGLASEGNKEGFAAVITCGDVAVVIIKRGRVLTCLYRDRRRPLSWFLLELMRSD